MLCLIGLYRPRRRDAFDKLMNLKVHTVRYGVVHFLRRPVVGLVILEKDLSDQITMAKRAEAVDLLPLPQFLEWRQHRCVQFLMLLFINPVILWMDPHEKVFMKHHSRNMACLCCGAELMNLVVQYVQYSDVDYSCQNR